jgi:hypothetical protein
MPIRALSRGARAREKHAQEAPLIDDLAARDPQDLPATPSNGEPLAAVVTARRRQGLQDSVVFHANP